MGINQKKHRTVDTEIPNYHGNVEIIYLLQVNFPLYNNEYNFKFSYARIYFLCS